MHQVRRQAEYNEAQDKRMNLIFSGIPESNGHETWAQTTQIIRDTVRDVMHLDVELFIQRAHRINAGYRDNRVPRRIVVKFGDWNQREQLLRNRRNLAGSNIYISEHFTAKTQYIRKCLTSEFSGAVDEQGRRPRLNYDKLWFGNCLYTWDADDNRLIKLRDLGQLPVHHNAPSRNLGAPRANVPLRSNINGLAQKSVSLSQNSILSQNDVLSQNNVLSQNSLLSQPTISHTNTTQELRSQLMPPPSSASQTMSSSSSSRRSFTFKII